MRMSFTSFSSRSDALLHGRLRERHLFLDGDQVHVGLDLDARRQELCARREFLRRLLRHLHRGAAPWSPHRPCVRGPSTPRASARRNRHALRPPRDRCGFPSAPHCRAPSSARARWSRCDCGSRTGRFLALAGAACASGEDRCVTASGSTVVAGFTTTISGLRVPAGIVLVAGTDAGDRFEFRTGGSRAIDHHPLAVRLEREDLLLVLDQEPLQQERRVDPWTIEVRDEHADLQVDGVDLGSHGPRILCGFALCSALQCNESCEGVRVLDLTRVLAGPWCTQNLADLGAEVIKIERPGKGDDTRSWGPPFLKDREGRDTADAAYYLACNRGKKSVTLDIASHGGPRDRALACAVGRCAGGELQGGRPRAPRSRLREPVERTSAPRLLFDHRLRPGRPVPRPARLRLHGAGAGRPDERHGRARRPARRRPAEGGRGRLGSLHRHVRDERDPRGAARIARRAGAASTSTWRCSTCRSRCSRT